MTKRKQESQPMQRRGKGWDIMKKSVMGYFTLATYPISVPAILAYKARRNTIVAKEEEIRYAWGQMEIELQRRMDLIDRLIDTVKPYVEHEQKVLSDIADARARMAGAIKRRASTDEKVQIADDLMGALSRLLIVVEEYPDLKAGDQFQDLRQRLVETEDRIASVRSYYNQKVLDYNKTIRSWPTSAIAQREGFQPHVYFGSPPAETLKESMDMGKIDNDEQGESIK